MEYSHFDDYYEQSIKIGTFAKNIYNIPRYDAATELICAAIPLNCTYHVYDVYDYGSVFDNGSATGKYKDIQTGFIDTFVPNFTPTELRMKAIDFSTTVFYADVLFVTRAPIIQPPPGLSLYMLQIVKWQVWLVFLTAIVLTSCLTGLITMSLMKVQGSQPDRFHWIVYAFTGWPALITHKHDDRNQSFDALRFVIACWSLAIMVLSAAYTGTLFANKMSIADPLPYDSFDTFVNCLESGKCQLAVTSNTTSTLNALFYSPQSDIAKRARASFQQNPLVIKDASQMVKTILGEKDKYIVWMVYSYIFASYYKMNISNICPFYAISTGYEEPCAYPLKKHSRYKSMINWAIATLHEMYLNKPLTSRVDGGDVSMCNIKYYRSSRGDVDNSMIYTSAAFLGGTMLVSTILLALEILSKRCKHGDKETDEKIKDPYSDKTEWVYTGSW